MRKINGLLFYSNGRPPLLSLVVAIHTLLKVYKGRVHVVFGPITPRFIIREIEEAAERLTCSTVKRRYHDDTVFDGTKREWWEKPHIIRNESPFTNTLYYDTDHLFRGEFDDSIFEEIESHKLVNPSVGHPRTEGKILRAIRNSGVWDATRLDQPIPKRWKRSNGGCIGVHKHGDTMDKLIHIMNIYLKSRVWRLYSNAEELALGTMVNTGHGEQVSDKWSREPTKTACYRERGIELEDGVNGVHYSGKSYRRCNAWAKAFVEACQQDFLGISSHGEFFNVGHRWLESSVERFLMREWECW